MLIDILSLFPAIAAAPLAESMIGKAQERGLVTIRSHNLRDLSLIHISEPTRPY